MAGISSIVKQAENVRRAGRKGDSVLAHINPREARLLKALGGAGTINPKTGLLEFYTNEEIANYISSVLAGPGSDADKAATINAAAEAAGVSNERIAEATGYALEVVNSYLAAPAPAPVVVEEPKVVKKRVVKKKTDA